MSIKGSSAIDISFTRSWKRLAMYRYSQITKDPLTREAELIDTPSSYLNSKLRAHILPHSNHTITAVMKIIILLLFLFPTWIFSQGTYQVYVEIKDTCNVVYEFRREPQDSVIKSGDTLYLSNYMSAHKDSVDTDCYQIVRLVWYDRLGNKKYFAGFNQSKE